MVDQQESVATDRNDGVMMPPAGLLAARYKISIDSRGRLERDRAIATDKESNERVFLKWSADVDAIEREATILQALTHPGIVGLRKKETSTQGGLLVLDLIDGVDLEAWLQTAGQGTDKPDLDQLFASLADAVAAVHEAGFIHRDLKPANILVRPDGSPVIVDFGAAASQDGPPGSHSLLTDGYGAPEQYRTDLAEGTWTDVYGLAAVAYRVVSGQAPPPAPAREKGEVLAPVADQAPAVDVRLAQAIDGGLALDPAARPQTAAGWRELFAEAEDMIPARAPSMDALDDYPPTIKVERRQGGGGRSEGGRAVRARAAASPAVRSSGGWRWAAWLTAAGLAALATFWFGRPFYERHIKDEWVVDGAGSGDTTSIGDALQRARDGSVVMIRPGSYRESLKIVRPVRLMAADVDAAPEIIAENAPCLQASGRGSSVSGLSFRAIASAKSDAGTKPVPCLVIAGGDLAVEASAIESTTGPAVVIGEGAEARIEASEIKAASGVGIVIGGEARAAVLDSRIVGGEGLSILVRGGAAPRIEDNAIEGGNGVLFVEGAGGVFSKNRIDGSRSSALRVAVGADPLIKDNKIEAAGGAGIFVYDGGRGRFEGNSIEASKLSGIVIGESADVRLSLNRIEGSGEHGVLVLDGGRAFLDGNDVVDNSGYGFAFAWDADVELGINELGGNKIPDLFDARLPRTPAASGPISAPPGTSGTSP